MNKHIDTKVFLRLQETAKGFDLYINNDKQELVIENGEIKNDLKEYQLKFIKDYV